MRREMIVLHSPLSPTEFEARFRERVEPDRWWAHAPMIWFSSRMPVLGTIDGDSFTLRRPATFSRRRVPLLIFKGYLSPDPKGGIRVAGYFSLHPLQVLLARVLGIGGVLFGAFEMIGMWEALRSGAVTVADHLLEILVPLAFIAYGIFGPAIARAFASGTEGFLLDFLRKDLLTQSDAESDLPILDSRMR